MGLSDAVVVLKDFGLMLQVKRGTSSDFLVDKARTETRVASPDIPPPVVKTAELD
jgi:hypothetical protein